MDDNSILNIHWYFWHQRPVRLFWEWSQFQITSPFFRFWTFGLFWIFFDFFGLFTNFLHILLWWWGGLLDFFCEWTQTIIPNFVKLLMVGWWALELKCNLHQNYYCNCCLLPSPCLRWGFKMLFGFTAHNNCSSFFKVLKCYHDLNLDNNCD